MLKKRSLLSARQMESSYSKILKIIDSNQIYLDTIVDDIIDEQLTTREIDMLCKEICKYLKDF